MAVTIPIISEFDGKGISKGIAEFKQLEGAGAKASFALKKAAVPAGLAVAGLTAFLVKAAKGAEEARQATQRLDQVLTSMGVPEATKRVSEYAEQLERTIAVDADVIKATQTKLATFSELTKTVEQAGGAFDRATLAALDLAAAGFGTAETNAIQLGKALQDPIKGITALAKSGVTFTEQEKDKIRVLVESNRMLEAQDIVLQAIEKQVGGTAQASASSFAKMQFALAGIADTFGEMVLPAVDKFAVMLQKVSGFVQANQKLVGILTLAVGGLAVGILALNTALKIATAAQAAFNLVMSANPIVLAIAGVAALAAGLVYLEQKTRLVSESWRRFGAIIGTVLGPVYQLVGGLASIAEFFGKELKFPEIKLPTFNQPTIPGAGLPSVPGATSGPDLLERRYGGLPTIPAPTVKLPTIKGGGGGGTVGIGGGGMAPGFDAGFIAAGESAAQTGFAGLDFSGMDLSGLQQSMQGGTNINVTVNSTIADERLGDTIVNALKQYNRRSGPLDVQIA